MTRVLHTGSKSSSSVITVSPGWFSLRVSPVADWTGITKRHSLNLGSAEFLRADVDPNSTPSSFTLPAKTLRDWLDHFALSSGPVSVGPQGGSRGETQLSWLFSREEIRIKSWEGWTRELTTEIKVDAGEFAQYWLENGDVEFTLPMREFRVSTTLSSHCQMIMLIVQGMLQLAESLAIDVSGAFSTAGQPLTLTSDPENEESESFDIFCAIATTVSDAFGGEDAPNGPAAPAAQRAESERSDKRSRTESTTNGRDGSERPEAQPRQSSTTPTSRKPSRLGFSAAPSQTTGGIFRSSLPAQSQQRREEALFLPSGSQEEEDAAFSAQISASQAAVPGQRLTQAEIEQMTGLGDLDQLADDLDMAEEEELRASQQQGNMDHHDYIPGETTTEGDTMGGPVFRAGESMFQPDETVLFGEERDEGGHSAAPTPPEEEEDEEMDEDEGMAPTQYAARQNTVSTIQQPPG